jgi:hypothetical protein
LRNQIKETVEVRPHLGKVGFRLLEIPAEGFLLPSRSKHFVQEGVIGIIVLADPQKLAIEGAKRGGIASGEVGIEVGMSVVVGLFHCHRDLRRLHPAPPLWWISERIIT